MMTRILTFTVVVLAVAGCGGGSSNSTGPTDTTAAAVPTPAPAPVRAPAPPPRQFLMVANVTGIPPGNGGCLIIQVDSPPHETGCDASARTTGDEGMRGTVTAVPDPGYRFGGGTPA
jgi:hypothetical protein